MPSTEVQRTLVKSPPELWAELSDPAALARHLGELGEIQLTRVEPESTVEWEAESVRGCVQLRASGWGTRVTFSLTRALPEPAAEPQATTEPRAATPEPTLPEPSEPELPEPAPATRALSEPGQTPEAGQAPETEPSRRRGFFARLFRRRRAALAPEIAEPQAAAPATAAESLETVAEPGGPAAEPEQPVAALSAPVATEPAIGNSTGVLVEAPAARATPEPQADRAEQSTDLGAELAAMEETIVEQDTALLTAVLDRLGAAHHRPFSRG